MFKFKKVASLMASAVMLSSTVALAAATTFPAPFVQNGASDVAIIYGSNAQTAITDLVAATNIADTLNSRVVGGSATTGTGTTTVSGEAYPLFTGGTKVYVNDTLNTVTSTLTKTELPTVLAKGSFSGNVEATYDQSIDLGSNPSITFAKQPTSSDTPEFGLTTSTSSGNIIYNATTTFSKAVNFTHADSKGGDLMLFGQKFTVASATDDSNLVLLKTAEKISLTSDDSSAEITVGGKTYTVELVSASDSAATVKVTDSDGNTETKEVNENASKKIQGVTIAVTNADETNLKLSASIIAGAEKVTISSTQGSSVKIGEDDKTIDGTAVYNTGGFTALTKLVFGVYASDSDKDAVMPGTSMVDPIFGTFKLDFPGLNIASDSTTSREDIKVTPSGDDKMEVNFMPGYASEAKSITWAKNLSTVMNLQYDDDSHNITVVEGKQTFRSGYIVVGNEESGRLVKVSTISNDSSTTNYGADRITFTDVFTGDSYDSTITAEGAASVLIGGKSYTIVYGGTGSTDTNWVRLNYPDSSGANSMILYPTIMTSKGANLAFYEPTTLNLSNWDGASNGITQLKFPDGDGYTDVTVASGTGGAGAANFTFGSGLVNTTAGAGVSSATVTVGKLTYNVSSSGVVNHTRVHLMNPESGGTIITTPALMLFEEKDDNSDYHAIIVTLDAGTSSSNGLDVSDVIRTWSLDSVNDLITMPGNSNLAKESDLWGTIITVDTGSSGHKKATISYPDEQVFANLYMAAESAAITGGEDGPGGSGTTVGVPILDSEASSMSTKNWIVVGGSCVNSVAADLLGASYPTCGADWTTSTGIGAGEYLVQTFAGTGGKVATLVAGFNAGDTTNAATYLRTQTGVDTTPGMKYKGTSSTTATLVTATDSTI